MLNILLDDNAYRAWLLSTADDLELMWDYFTTLAEAAEEDDIPTRKLERIINQQYCGGIVQAALDNVPA